MKLDNKNDILFKTSENIGASSDESSTFLKTNSEQEGFNKNKEIKKEKLLSKIDKRFSNDQTNVKIVLFIGVLAIVLGAWHLVSGIKNAFVFSPIVLEDKAGVIENLNNLKDTDNDGLSDYEERYVYGTSPYLADTDSDGISDYDEILAGQEPLCAGDTCNLEDETNLNVLESGPPEQMTLDELKNELIEAGYPIEEVNKLSAEDLNLIYGEVEKAINNENYIYTDVNENSGEEFAPSAEELEELQNLSIDEIRQLLIQSGASNEQLESVSDEELRSLYLEALQSL